MRDTTRASTATQAERGSSCGWDSSPPPASRGKGKVGAAGGISLDWARRHPDIAGEERALRKARHEALKRFGHKRNGTPETHAKAAEVRQGALARLWQSGAIDADALAAGAEIALVHQRIGADVNIHTASLETRVDNQRHGSAFFESLSAVRLEIAYGRWRCNLGAKAALVLDIVVHDVGIAAAARTHRMHVRRARALLITALDDWSAERGRAWRTLTPGELAQAHAAIFK